MYIYIYIHRERERERDRETERYTHYLYKRARVFAGGSARGTRLPPAAPSGAPPRTILHAVFYALCVYIYIYRERERGRVSRDTHTMTTSETIGGTQTGSYQTGSYQKGRFIPPKPKLLYLLFLIRPSLYASETTAGVLLHAGSAANLRTKILDFKGSDSCRI